MMNRKETLAFIASLKKLRASATDEQSVNAPAVYPAWNVGITYTTGDRVLYNEILYKVLQNHTSQETWTPEAAPSLFAKVLIPDIDVIPEWVQPDSTNPYMKGDKVTYKGKTWISTIDNNVWAPGEYGWDEI
jgi:chitodextrinase